MASEKRPPGEAHEHTDQSIKARKGQLFEAKTSTEVTSKSKTFTEYVKDTPPTPMSPAVKAALWAVAVLVVLLFLGALFGGRSRGSKAGRARTPSGRREVMASLDLDPAFWRPERVWPVQFRRLGLDPAMEMISRSKLDQDPAD